MQILESSMLGLRAARLVLSDPRSSLSVTLLPMVHVGDRAFYQSVYADALSHDVALEEGVKSPVSWRLTRAYRWIDPGRLGLVIQPRMSGPENGGARIVLADLTTEEFHREWRKVPLWLRLAASIGAPVFGLHQRFFASRDSIAERMSLEDRRSPEEILSWTPRLAPFWHSILDARDARLVNCLSAELHQANGQPRRIAIVYGARHMRAVLAHLVSRGFTCTDSSWREIIAL